MKVKSCTQEIGFFVLLLRERVYGKMLAAVPQACAQTTADQMSRSLYRPDSLPDTEFTSGVLAVFSVPLFLLKICYLTLKLETSVVFLSSSCASSFAFLICDTLTRH